MGKIRSKISRSLNVNVDWKTFQNYPLEFGFINCDWEIELNYYKNLETKETESLKDSGTAKETIERYPYEDKIPKEETTQEPQVSLLEIVISNCLY